ncbi:aromatic ring-hydroxylating dioxygenase subunit alpha [Rhodoblastus acidophilus]|uniref:Aromatic ring-hydroxylating dioxygenase subunit alpha n=1 Tax=Candidatus Rhodoblastus alkanivorans TaxID=2954117 RepID=A0ABS9Z7Z0_9HYPH|nr:aromatic ring-hydroxylating dioxygenase subunit alpha [Candidatus Rhodoblastus alkanivorans]MCI4677904.1 aromatic ring-hydroxylating dioxygenase subunit alpha [Candidatus Rhodoblastus alkanivorans]MCI4683800.1 aromatic ring-hydroxylating dioxygenase subunit alpha [Candidatus Rhodoblastus alkanivorans]MDI4641118.1 aromatic ring-hydroxylating dioxygenase subunit alpha [Rhodoblastus acidophilus]
MNSHVSVKDEARPASPFLQRAWYAAALSSEVGPTELFHRKLLNVNVLIYRKQDGTPVAMRDRCPHRFAPMHLGKRQGDEVSCLYHALRFNSEGQCVHNPHGSGAIPKAAKIRAYPLIEKYGYIWIWMADEDPDPSLLPDYTPLEEGHPNGVAHTYMYMNANYELIIDNVMDLSHIDHVHGEIITTRGQLSPVVPKVIEGERSINARWEWKQTPAMHIFSKFMPDTEAEARQFFDITWRQPANIQLSVGAIQGTGNLDLKDCVGQYDLHTTTPETETTTHYWFSTRRNHIVEDGEFNAFKIKAMHEAFVTEDGPIIEETQKEMGTSDFFSLNPVLMSNDVAPVKVRRLLHKLIEAERGA